MTAKCEDMFVLCNDYQMTTTADQALRNHVDKTTLCLAIPLIGLMKQVATEAGVEIIHGINSTGLNSLWMMWL